MSKFNEFKQRHMELVSFRREIEDNNLSGEDLVVLAKKFVTDVTLAGSEIRQQRERHALTSLLMFWAAYINDRTGEYPSTELEPVTSGSVSYSNIIFTTLSIVLGLLMLLGLFVAIKYLYPGVNVSNLSSAASLLISIGAAVFVIVYRRQIVSVAGSVVEGGVEFVTRITKRRTASTPKAYLKAVAGVESGRTVFDLYGTTPIGKSRRNSELIFQADEEDSPISRLHCTILEDDGVFSIRDEDSQWGTYLNDIKLQPLEPVELHEGNIIELAQVERGGIKLQFSLTEPSEGDSSPISDDSDEGIRNTRPRRR